MEQKSLPNPTGKGEPIAMRRATGARLVVVEQVHHQQAGSGSLQSVPTRFERKLQTDEQVWQRKFSVGEDWRKIDCGWVKTASMLVLQCDKEHFHVNPTKEQRQVAESRIVEWGVVLDSSDVAQLIQPIGYIPPGESARWQPLVLDSLRIRCRNGQARVTVTVVPGD